MLIVKVGYISATGNTSHNRQNASYSSTHVTSCVQTPTDVVPRVVHTKALQTLKLSCLTHLCTRYWCGPEHADAVYFVYCFYLNFHNSVYMYPLLACSKVGLINWSLILGPIMFNTRAHINILFTRTQKA